MRMRLSIAACTASLFIALPAFAQGNNSDHSGHDNDGKSAGHRKDAPHGFGRHDMVLSTPVQAAAVSNALNVVSSQLRSGSCRAAATSAIPAAAQANVRALLESDDGQAPTDPAISAKLYAAGPKAGKIVPDLLNGLAALRSQPAVLPSVVICGRPDEACC